MASLENVAADDPSAPSSATPANAAPADSASADAVPTKDNSQDTSRAQVPDASQTPVNPQSTTIPLFPIQPGNPVSPYTSSSSNPQSPQLTAPSLYVTGSNDLNQIATNNALRQAFSSQGNEGAGFYSEPGMDYEHPPIERIRLGPFDLQAVIAGSVVGDDNVRSGGNDQTGKKSDVSFGETPAVQLVYGAHDGQKGFASLVYAPTLTQYYHESNQNNVGQNVALNAIYPFQRLTLLLTEAYTQTTGVNQDSTQRTTQTSNLTTFGGTYDVDEKISVSSLVQAVISKYSSPGGSQNSGSGGQGDTTTTINNSLTYRFSPKLTVGPNFNFGWDNPQGEAKQTYEQAGMGLNYTPTEKIGLFAQAGAEFRQYDRSGAGNEVNPIFAAGIGYSPFDSTTLSISASQSVHSSTAESGQPTANQTVLDTGVGFNISQRILQRFNLGFSFDYSHNDNQGTNGSSGSGSSSSQETLTYRPSLSFSPAEWTSITIYYQYLANQSDIPGSAYNDNQVGISVSAQF